MIYNHLTNREQAARQVIQLKNIQQYFNDSEISQMQSPTSQCQTIFSLKKDLSRLSTPMELNSQSPRLKVAQSVKHGQNSDFIQMRYNQKYQQRKLLTMQQELKKVEKPKKNADLIQHDSPDNSFCIWEDMNLIQRGIDTDEWKDLNRNQPLGLYSIYKARCCLYPNNQQQLTNEQIVSNMKRLVDFKVNIKEINGYTKYILDEKTIRQFVDQDNIQYDNTIYMHQEDKRNDPLFKQRISQRRFTIRDIVYPNRQQLSQDQQQQSQRSLSNTSNQSQPNIQQDKNDPLYQTTIQMNSIKKYNDMNSLREEQSSFNDSSSQISENDNNIKDIIIKNKIENIKLSKYKKKLNQNNAGNLTNITNITDKNEKKFEQLPEIKQKGSNMQLESTSILLKRQIIRNNNFQQNAANQRNLQESINYFQNINDSGSGGSSSYINQNYYGDFQTTQKLNTQEDQQSESKKNYEKIQKFFSNKQLFKCSSDQQLNIINPSFNNKKNHLSDNCTQIPNIKQNYFKYQLETTRQQFQRQFDQEYYNYNSASPSKNKFSYQRLKQITNNKFFKMKPIQQHQSRSPSLKDLKSVNKI